jgi:hypothetical protein
MHKKWTRKISPERLSLGAATCVILLVTILLAPWNGHSQTATGVDLKKVDPVVANGNNKPIQWTLEAPPSPLNLTHDRTTEFVAFESRCDPAEQARAPTRFAFILKLCNATAS